MAWKFNPFTKRLDYYETGGGGVTTYPEVANYAALPDNSGGAYVGKIYVVLNSSGIWPFTKKSGFWIGRTTTWEFQGVMTLGSCGDYDPTGITDGQYIGWDAANSGYKPMSLDALLIDDMISADGDTTHAPTRNALFGELALKADTLTLASIVSTQLAACPRMDFQVWGDSSDGGTTPDSTTQTSINALLAAGVPESNIVWRYTPLAGTFTIASLASTATIDTVTLLAGNYFVVADLTVPSSIDNVTLVGLTESVFYDSTPIVADGVLSGIYNFNTTSLNKSGVAFTPTSTADISKIAMRLTSRGASVHNTANTIRCRIFSDNGSGLPNIATGLIATATAAGISANDTIFTPVFVFATSADNYASKINFASGVKKHFVFDIPTASGNTAYSTVGQDTANASYPEQYTIYTSDSGGTTWAQQVWEPKFTLYKVA